MSFADLKKELESCKSKLRGTKRKASDGAKKYMRRGDLETERKAKVRRERERRKAKRMGLPDEPEEEKDEETPSAEGSPSKRKEIENLNIGGPEIRRRLRALGQPITLFGENDKDRLIRLKRYELEAHERDTSSMGAGNLFSQLMTNDVENDILRATMQNQQGDDDGQNQKLREKLQKRAEKYANPRPREDFKADEPYILFWLKRTLKEWEDQLNARPEEVQRSTKGKIAATTYKQTRQNLRPLVKDLKHKTCGADMLPGILKIVSYCKIREYVKANEAYLTLAIGNAAWPMGVTMVGIHERAGREKIFSQQVAHVLNDEVQRKYVQAMKRLMTFHQHKYPNRPSKMVN